MKTKCVGKLAQSGGAKIAISDSKLQLDLLADFNFPCEGTLSFVQFNFAYGVKVSVQEVTVKTPCTQFFLRE